MREKSSKEGEVDTKNVHSILHLLNGRDKGRSGKFHIFRSGFAWHAVLLLSLSLSLLLPSRALFASRRPKHITCLSLMSIENPSLRCSTDSMLHIVYLDWAFLLLLLLMLMLLSRLRSSWLSASFSHDDNQRTEKRRRRHSRQYVLKTSSRSSLFSDLQNWKYSINECAQERERANKDRLLYWNVFLFFLLSFFFFYSCQNAESVDLERHVNDMFSLVFLSSRTSHHLFWSKQVRQNVQVSFFFVLDVRPPSANWIRVMFV